MLGTASPSEKMLPVTSWGLLFNRLLALQVVKKKKSQMKYIHEIAQAAAFWVVICPLSLKKGSLSVAPTGNVLRIQFSLTSTTEHSAHTDELPVICVLS